MELLISILAIIISLASVLVTVLIYKKELKRAQKQATLDAYNTLQVQVFDELNKYTYYDIRHVCNVWNQVVEERKSHKKVQLTQEEKDERDRCFNEYRTLSGYLARIEHFALGVNTGIYDVKIAERAGTLFLKSLYNGKLKPLIETKSKGNSNVEYYAEFRKLVESIEKIEE